METIINNIKKKIEGYELQIQPTIDNRYQFETNSKNKFMADRLGESLDTLQKRKDSIGMQLFKLKGSPFYSDMCNPDSLNKTEETSVLFTEELFKQFQLDAIEFWIEYYSKQLISGSISESSSSKLSNLQFEWEVQMKQKLIVSYKDLLNKY